MLIYRVEGVAKSRCGKSTGGIHWQHLPRSSSQLAVAWEKVTEINVLSTSFLSTLTIQTISLKYINKYIKNKFICSFILNSTSSFTLWFFSVKFLSVYIFFSSIKIKRVLILRPSRNSCRHCRNDINNFFTNNSKN